MDERKNSGKYPLPEFGLLNHYMINLFSRDENRDDMVGLTAELMRHIPGYAEYCLEMNRRMDESK